MLSSDAAITHSVVFQFARRGAALLLAISAMTAYGQSPRDQEPGVTGFGYSAAPIRVDSDHIQTYGQSWTSGDILGLWTPYEEGWQQVNGSNITSGLTSSANPESVAQTTWTSTLHITGPGPYRDYSSHWFVPSPSCWDQLTFYIGNTTGPELTIQRPAVSGVAAIWWLGNGVLADNGYYAQSLLSVTPNGASGTPSWSVSTVSGGGSVRLSCTTCTSNTITSTAPSSGCVYDATIYASYGGFNSDPFHVAVIKPSTMTLIADYPSDQANGDGFISTYQWSLSDTCRNVDPGLDGNEVFGSWVNDTANNWRKPSAAQSGNSSYIWQDEIGMTNCGGGCSPVWTSPQSPLSTTAIMRAPWTAYFGTQTFGSGVAVMSNTTQFYLDHGRHQ